MAENDKVDTAIKILGGIGKGIGTAVNASHPVTGGIALATALGLGTRAIYKRYQRKKAEKLLNEPDEISPEDKKWKEEEEIA